MIDTATSQVLSHNQQVYQRLKLALNLSLHRQIFVAVCDNLSLRDRLVRELSQELSSDPTKELDYPRLVTLRFNASNPNLLSQIAQWLKQNPPPPNATELPSFQIVGIESLTRQPIGIQRRFIRHLQLIERYLPRLESNLLLWIPNPWLNTIRQSAPEFWRWCTGVFNFEGEPTPTPRELPPQPVKEEPPQEQNKQPEKQIKLVESLSKSPPEDEEEQQLNSPQLLSLEEIEQLQKESASRETVAEAYLELGNYYRDLIARGETATENITIAIQAYFKWLQLAPEDEPSAAEILNDLGNFYWMLSRRTQVEEQKLAYIQQAVHAYQLGSSKVLDNSQTYAMIQNNLGAAYSELSRYRDRAENLQKSIAAYQEALHYRSPEIDPHKYGSTQNNLGTAYWHLAQLQEPAKYLQAATEAYKEALAQYNPEEVPLNWAMIQNNLGTAYWNLAQYEKKSTWLQFAIEAYQQALKYRTPENAPAACAATYNNLGTAYWHLSLQAMQQPQLRQAYLRQATAAYSKTLDLVQNLRQQDPPAGVNFDYLSTYSNLGLIHHQLATEGQFGLEATAKSAHLQAALKSHLQVLERVEPDQEIYENTFKNIVKTVRSFYQECGISGQNLALSLIPGELLPQILPRL